MRGFASDNYAGAHPAVLAALAEANRDHAAAYGIDPWTVRANELLRERFGADAHPWLVWGGTGANVLALGSLCRSWEAVITPVTAPSGPSGYAIFTTDPDATRAIMDGDPGVVAGIFTYEVHPLRGFPGATLP